METTNTSSSNTKADNTATGLAATMVEPKTPQAHTDTSAPTGFLDLPAELRNRVYELALPPTFKIDAYGIHWGKSELRIPGMLRVSRQIRQEALGIWLADTNFVYRYTSNLLNFLQLIGKRNAGELKTVRCEQMSFSLRSAHFHLAETREVLDGCGLAMGALEVQHMIFEWEKDKDGKERMTDRVSYVHEPDSD